MYIGFSGVTRPNVRFFSLYDASPAKMAGRFHIRWQTPWTTARACLLPSAGTIVYSYGAYCRIHDVGRPTAPIAITFSWARSSSYGCVDASVGLEERSMKAPRLRAVAASA